MGSSPGVLSLCAAPSQTHKNRPRRGHSACLSGSAVELGQGENPSSPRVLLALSALDQNLRAAPLLGVPPASAPGGKKKVRCPDDRCTGGDETRQRPVDRETLINADVPEEEWLSNAWKCRYCDWVYSNEWDRGGGRYVRTVRGRFGGNTLMLPGQWDPFDGPYPIVSYSR